jgi:hypothetical protein
MTDIRDDLTDARNTLLAAPSMSGDETVVCTDLLVPDAPEGASVLWVSYRRDPAACLDQWTGQTGRAPREAAVVVVGEGDETSIEGATVERVSNPSDLTGLGIVIGRFISSWEGDPVVCFDSVTATLQYVDVETAYEFLHTITGQLYAAAARAHFHVDPTAHDSQTVDALASLFDAAVFLGEGEPEIRQRRTLD